MYLPPHLLFSQSWALISGALIASPPFSLQHRVLRGESGGDRVLNGAANGLSRTFC